MTFAKCGGSVRDDDFAPVLRRVVGLEGGDDGDGVSPGVQRLEEGLAQPPVAAAVHGEQTQHVRGVQAASADQEGQRRLQGEGEGTHLCRRANAAAATC